MMGGLRVKQLVRALSLCIGLFVKHLTLKIEDLSVASGFTPLTSSAKSVLSRSLVSSVAVRLLISVLMSFSRPWWLQRMALLPAVIYITIATVALSQSALHSGWSPARSTAAFLLPPLCGPCKLSDDLLAAFAN